MSRLADHQVRIILEHFDDKFDRLIEAFQIMGDRMNTLAKDEDLQAVKADVKVIKKAVAATNQDLHKLKKRVDRSEGLAHSHA